MKKVLIEEYDLKVVRKDDRYVGHICGIPFIARGNPRHIIAELLALRNAGLSEVLAQDFIIGRDYFIFFDPDAE